MIGARDQYAFVDLSQVPEMRIDGGILPARDVAADGSWRVLRGEDAAFLQEAARERVQAATGATVPPHAMTRVLSADRMEDARGRLAACASLHGYCKDPPEDAQAIDGLDAFATAATAHGLAWSDGEPALPAFGAFRALRADDVRALFRAVSRLRQFEVHGAPFGISNGAGAEYAVELHEERPGANAAASAPPLGLVEHVCDDAWRGTSREEVCFARDAVVAGGDWSLTVPEAARPWIASVRAFVRLRYASVETPPGGAAAETSDYIVAPVESAFSDGVCAVARASLVDAAQAARARRGYVPRALGSGWSQVNRVSADGLSFICSLTGHTDFSGIGWTWQPNN
ncbi:MAG: hypothetical protein ACI4RA_05555 [Kiritimatiellia bacterium]